MAKWYISDADVPDTNITITSKSLTHVQINEEKLLFELKCPGCGKYLSPAIMMCTTGHNLCTSCHNHSPNCPICSQSFINTRNLALERISEYIVTYCSNNIRGCSERLPVSLMLRHETWCTYCLNVCIMIDKESSNICDWTGIPIKLLQHLNSCHLERIWPLEIPRIILFVIAPTHIKYYLAYEDYVFWLHIKCDPESNSYYQAVQYVGPGYQEGADRFIYSISFRSRDGLREICYTRTTHLWEEDVELLFETADCFHHKLSFIKHLLNEADTCLYELTIIRKDEISTKKETKAVVKYLKLM